MEPRRSTRVSKPVFIQEDIDAADEIIQDTLKRKIRGKAKVEEGCTSSQTNPTKKRKPYTKTKKNDEQEVKILAEETEFCKLTGQPVPYKEAITKWPKRYPEIIEKRHATKKSDKEVLPAKWHYSSAEVYGTTYRLNDDAYVQSDDDQVPHICRIVEFFRTQEGQVFFSARWYYRSYDTVIQAGVQQSGLIQEKRIFLSDVIDENPLDCLIEKTVIPMIAHNVDILKKQEIIANSRYYCDMYYNLDYRTFIHVPPYTAENTRDARDVFAGLSSDTDSATCSNNSFTPGQSSRSELSLLDLYAGCGAMSTGLCLGAKVGGVNIVTRWALDLNESACQTLALNHPETKVTNDCGENFLSLLREWEKLCHRYNLLGTSSEFVENDSREREDCEVEEILGISFGNPDDLENFKKFQGEEEEDDEIKIPKGTELYFKVHWKSFKSSKDTWEPISNLSNCKEKIRNFVTTGYYSNLLPLPGDVDVICGGPPCQGISGNNLHRNVENPFGDEKNYQMVVYMDIVEFLKPGYILMENVVDLLKFANGFLGRYAMSRLVSMDYQVRVGVMAAGSFGLPQFRQRVFLWGAQLGKKLPPYPLPTHEVIGKNAVPAEFDNCIVAYDETIKLDLKKPLFLGDALKDLPEVENGDIRDTVAYDDKLGPQNDFQRYIRMNRTGEGLNAMLYDHIPLPLNKYDYQRVSRIPREKGAFFVDLGGVKLVKNKDGKQEWVLDPSKERVFLAPGKPLIPNYALSFRGGHSNKPFGRSSWDEIVSTVLTRAEPHNHYFLSGRTHVFKGFFDYYKLCGDVRDMYIQVGNAVAVPVAKALGFALALAVQGLCSDEPLIKLPDDFTFSVEPLPFSVEETEYSAVEDYS
ncbi:hypothetical protein MKW92_046923 [Papaver armeniacum]|nr:hypothetical protein MKW92_046923 [Papaver armeniacum]